MKTKILELGSLCDSISKQLSGCMPSDELESLDVMNDAITTCYVHGLITDSETGRARKRMVKIVHKKIGESTSPQSQP